MDKLKKNIKLQTISKKYKYKYILENEENDRIMKQNSNEYRD